MGFPVLGVRDLARAVAFWSAALDLVVRDEWRSAHWTTLGAPNGTGGTDRTLALMTSASPAEPHPRLHLDLLVDTTDEQDAEVERLVRLGATRVPGWPYPPAADFVVLADPDGNPFCVVDPSRAPSGSTPER